METSKSEGDDTGKTDALLNQVTARLFGVQLPIGDYSNDMRGYLQQVLDLYDGKVDQAVGWLESKCKMLDGQSPVELLRAGNVARLRGMWDECSEMFDRQQPLADPCKASV